MGKKKALKKTLPRRNPREPVARAEAKKPRRGRPAAGGRPTGDGTPEQAVLLVGVGASAGGLDAFSQMLDALPAQPGFAIVFVQHLSPTHDSVLPHLLAPHSKMPVVQATEDVQVEADKVYIIPPNAQIEFIHGRLHLTPRPGDHTQYTPIDFFFRSLASEAAGAAIAVVLSGTSSDGARGVREIKAAGGIVLAQEPGSAKYDGMPRAALATGLVDRILPPAQLAQELVAIAQHPRLRHPRPRRAGEDLPVADEQLQRIFKLLRKATGVDFTLYKTPTIKRRLQRRMILQKIAEVDQYVRFLDENPAEVQALYQDVLIHVTGFFREPDTFEALKDTVFPRLVEGHRGNQPIRIWVPGCSTGEEAYSVAMLLLEFLGDNADNIPVQVFATDVAEATVDHARTGIYPLSIEGVLSPERLRRFFIKTDGVYRVSKPLRDLCIFARQDLTRDPPFSRVDLIVCRNVLIYLSPPLQKRLMGVFHYALKPDGFLMLAAAETVGTSTDLFMAANKKHRIYRKKAIESPPINMPFGYTSEALRSKRTTGPRTHEAASPQVEASRIILQRYSPPGVLVDNDLQILEFRGQTGPYLEPAPGNASLSLLKMAREGLIYGLRAALTEARKTDRPARKEGLRVWAQGQARTVTLEVTPVPDGAQNRCFLVIFEEQRPSAAPAAAGKKGKKSQRAPRESETMRRLQGELAASRDHMQAIIQDLEAANEELQSANEEILSSNEELQSTNEELDTAKEELQSTNEELNTVNEELHARNEEMSRANSDLVNLLGSVQIAIVIVANDLRIRRFTPMAGSVLNLIPADVGRPIGQIKPNIECPELEQMIAEVIESVAPRETEVHDAAGNWYALRVRPYKNVENRIDGAVLSLFDITMARQEVALRAALEVAEAVIESVSEPLMVVGQDLRIWHLNRSFAELFGVPAEAHQRSLAELGPPWEDKRIENLLRGALTDHPQRADRFAIERDGRPVHLRTRRIDGSGSRPPLILLVAEPADGLDS